MSFVNRNYDVCDTYPADLIVPVGISDSQLRLVSEFRSRGRLPGILMCMYVCVCVCLSFIIVLVVCHTHVCVCV